MVKEKKPCQSPGCKKGADVFLTSVPGKSGDYCLKHAREIDDEHSKKMEKWLIKDPEKGYVFKVKK